MSKKDVYYFSHDCNAHQDVKHKAMMSAYGAEGYGWFWILIELMRQEEGYKLSIARKFDIPSLASSLPNCDATHCKTFIDDCIEEFELFQSDGEYIWSNSLLKRMEKVDNNRELKRKAANARWNKNKKNEKPFDDMDTNVDEPKKKKDEDPAKIKDKRVLNDDKIFDIFLQQLVASKGLENLSHEYIYAERDKCIDWLASTGKTQKDYKAFFRNWLRRNSDNAPAAQPVVKKRGLVL